ncbi:four helix bundle protein [Candidatus Poribacteria bacterium]|nr:four helix bundle protein [Candidatus Poribacteria bacterium]
MEVYEETKDFPPEERYGLTAQMRRAAVSVCANMAEVGALWARRGSLSDDIRFLFIAQGSLSELESLLHIAHRLSYLSHEAYRQFASFQSEAAKRLSGLIKAKQRQQPWSETDTGGFPKQGKNQDGLWVPRGKPAQNGCPCWFFPFSQKQNQGLL